MNSITATRVSSLRLADIVVAVVEGTAAFLFLVREVDVDRGRTWTALSWQLRVLSLQLVGHIDLIQMLLQQADVLAIALDRSVCEVADEGDETNNEVKCKVEHHHEENTLRQTARHLTHAQDELERKERISGVTNGGYEANDGGPAEAHAHETEQGEIKSVGRLAGPGEDVGLLLWDVGRNFLFDLLRLARLPRVGDLLVVRVLTRGQLTVQRSEVETAYIWSSSGLAGILVHLACKHLLRRILCDKLGHGCGIAGIVML